MFYILTHHVTKKIDSYYGNGWNWMGSSYKFRESCEKRFPKIPLLKKCRTFCCEFFLVSPQYTFRTTGLNLELGQLVSFVPKAPFKKRFFEISLSGSKGQKCVFHIFAYITQRKRRIPFRSCFKTCPI